MSKKTWFLLQESTKNAIAYVVLYYQRQGNTIFRGLYEIVFIIITLLGVGL